MANSAKGCITTPRFNPGDKVYLISPQGECEPGYTVKQSEPDYVELEWTSKLDSGPIAKKMWFDAKRVSHKEINKDFLKLEKYFDKLQKHIAPVQAFLSIYKIFNEIPDHSTYKFEFSCYSDVMLEDLKKELLADGHYAIKINASGLDYQAFSWADDVTFSIKDKKITNVSCSQQEPPSDWNKEKSVLGWIPKETGHTHNFAIDPLVLKCESLEEKYAQFGINLRLNNEHISSLRSSIAELKEKPNTSKTVENYDALLKRVEALEKAELSKKILETQKHTPRLPKQIEPGTTVWSKATKSGPWVAICSTEVEVGVSGGNLNGIQRVTGWIVRGKDNVETVFPSAELTASSPRAAENPNPKGLVWYTKLILAVCSMLIASFLYLRFVL